MGGGGELLVGDGGVGADCQRGRRLVGRGGRRRVDDVRDCAGATAASVIRP